MAKRMLIDATHTEETRAVVVSGNRLEEFDFESTTKTQLKGNIYLAKVTRVEPSLQAAFVDYGGNRHGFLAFSEIHPDYYRIPVADREALLAEVSSQEDDIDIDDSGVEEIDDDDAMDTTSPHDDDGVMAAEDDATENEVTEGEATADLGAGDHEETTPDTEALEPDEDSTPREAAEGVDQEPEGASTDPAADHTGDEAVAATGDDAESDPSTTEAGDPTPDGDAADESAPVEKAADAEAAANEGDATPDDKDAKDDKKSDGPTPWYARMDQEDIVVRGKKPEEADENDGAEESEKAAPPEEAESAAAPDSDPDAAESVNDVSDDEDRATPESAADSGGEDTVADPADAETTGDADPGDGETAAGSDDSDTAEATADTPDSDDAPANKESARAPSSRRRRGRGRRDRDVESVGGEDSDDFERSKAWHRRYRIQEVISRRQILLVQVAKEERGNKGAALTTYISLAGRYCVLMPNTPRGGGISRKIANPKDRRKLKEIVGGLNIPPGMAVIVRTAGAQRTKAEIRRDYEYLIKLWDEIRERTLQSTAPSLIHEEANLIKRSIRDLYSKDIDEVLVEGDEGYKTAKGFMKLLMPSHAKRVKAYKEEAMPLFHRYQIEQQIDNIYSPTVQLKSGGYIVLNATEALVAIDVNSGRATRERNIEETAYRTNLEAADEIARQLRLRDLAGLIVIDFIDMEEGRNRYNVERRLKEAMKHDRARIQLGRISAFGLLEMSRQRLRPSIAEISAQPCPTCGGSGVVRSIESSALQILRAIEEEGMRQRSKAVTVSMPSEVAFYIMNNKRAALAEIESRYELDVFLRGDDNLVPPEHELDIGDSDSEAAPVKSRKKGEDAEDGEKGKKRRRRRRSRSEDGDDGETGANDAETAGTDDDTDDSGSDGKSGKRGSRRRGRRGGRKRKKAETEGADAGSSDDDADGAEVTSTADAAADADTPDSDDGDEDREKPRRRRRRRGSGRARNAETEASDADTVSAVSTETAEQTSEPIAEAPAPAVSEPAIASPPPPAPEPAIAEPAPALAPESSAADEKSQKRRGGWWSFGKAGD